VYTVYTSHLRQIVDLINEVLSIFSPMNNGLNYSNEELSKKLTILKNSVQKTKKEEVKKRISRKPNFTDLEYLLGAFMEMYDPHLQEIVVKLSQKGYAIDAESGFGGKFSEIQMIIGDFSVDYVVKNKLEKIGVKFRDYNGSQSLVFWPEESSLTHIQNRWNQVLNVLPDKGLLATPSRNRNALTFRRKFIPQDLQLQKQRLFVRLKFATDKKIEIELTKRKEENARPDKIEQSLGLFIEEIEPQVRQAFLTLYKKGYSIDKAGFMDNPSDQMIEGDFQLEEKTVAKLQKIGVIVETNHSGYTRIQFTPEEADHSKIKKKWKEITALIPDKHEAASPSMTKKARDFRQRYQ